MSYNPAFVGDESPVGSSGEQSSSSRAERNSGIQLTSFKVLQNQTSQAERIVLDVASKTPKSPANNHNQHQHHHHHHHHHSQHPSDQQQQHQHHDHKHQEHSHRAGAAAKRHHHSYKRKAASDATAVAPGAVSKAPSAGDPSQCFISSTSSSSSLINDANATTTSIATTTTTTASTASHTCSSNSSNSSSSTDSYSYASSASSLASINTTELTQPQLPLAQLPLAQNAQLVKHKLDTDNILNAPGAAAAVECRNMRYDVGPAYRQKTILHDINVTVPEGSIYGLLGPSGCGKTTMLRCVVGRIKPKAGYVRVFGYRPNQTGSRIPGPAIGYMPQEISVYEDFTIYETLTYFGKINNMRHELIKARIDFLLKFLDLPGKHRLMASLSGGQKRRVSLAAALVHSPPLLILDEPTVGVDPLLRQSIWKHLVTLAQTEKITVIITTHYIEEARQANVVGLMRQGKLLAEDSPDALMAQHSMDSLEEVFLKLCITDSSREASRLAGQSGSPFRRELSPVLGPRELEEATAGARQRRAPRAAAMLLDANGLEIVQSSQSDRVVARKKRQIPSIFVMADGTTTTTTTTTSLDDAGDQPQVHEGGAQAQKDTRLSTALVPVDTDTDAGGVAVPDFVVNKYGLRSMAPGSKYAPEKVSVATWTKSLTAVTWKNFVRLKRNPSVLMFEFILPAVQVILFCLCIGGDPFDVPLAVVNDELIPTASRLFLDAIDKRAIRQVHFDNLTDAIESVRRGETWGAIHIPDRYTQFLQERLTHPGDVSPEGLANATIQIYPDLTNLHLALAMENTFREAFVKFARDALHMFGYEPEAAELPIRVEKPVYGSLQRNGYLEFMAPGVVISITYVMATGLTALAFILEKRDGLLERSLVSGVTTSQILLAHASVQVVVMFIQIGLVLTFTFYVFGIPSNGPFIWVILLILLQGMTGMAFGLLVSAVCEEENSAVMMLVGTFYTNLILAGIIWPLEAMPRFLKIFSYMQPQTLPTETLRNILSRGWGITEPGVYIGFLVTIGWLAVFLVAAGLFMRYSK